MLPEARQMGCSSIGRQIGGHMHEISEDQIRVRYQLWELSGRPFGDNDRFWREAEAELEFLQARDEIRAKK
jgi:Protein of unknown function (DUF2934)